jgi:glycosyltransferase involved in cell wall biosynthesis
MSRLSILYIAYPLLAVTEESAGGAEQMLLTVERGMAALGHRTTVAGADGSHVCGTLLPTGAAATEPDQYEAREREHNARILSYLREHPREFDLIHDESGSFFRLADECPVPVLATLHLPRSFYREEWFQRQNQDDEVAPRIRVETVPQSLPRASRGVRVPPLDVNLGPHSCNPSLNCVSHSQARTFEGFPNLLGVVQNGIAVEQFPFTRDKDDYVLWLGRICEEKAPHLAIAAAQAAKLPIVIAGQIYPFRYHQNYFEREIRPHLNGRVRFVDTPLVLQKIELLRHARALLLTSTVEETSSLVAMEAMACGTPVVGFRRGAFPEIVTNSETGFIVDTIEEMAAALRDVDSISPEKCRARVELHFSSSRMAREYEALYRRVLTSQKRLAA